MIKRLISFVGYREEVFSVCVQCLGYACQANKGWDTLLWLRTGAWCAGWDKQAGNTAKMESDKQSVHLCVCDR